MMEVVRYDATLWGESPAGLYGNNNSNYVQTLWGLENVETTLEVGVSGSPASGRCCYELPAGKTFLEAKDEIVLGRPKPTDTDEHEKPDNPRQQYIMRAELGVAFSDILEFAADGRVRITVTERELELEMYDIAPGARNEVQQLVMHGVGRLFGINPDRMLLSPDDDEA